MKQIDVNWSECIRQCVQKKIDQQKRQVAFDKLDEIRKYIKVLDIANRFGIAVYDAAYIFLSEKQAPFISSDTKLIEKVKDHFQIINLREILLINLLLI